MQMLIGIVIVWYYMKHSSAIKYADLPFTETTEGEQSVTDWQRNVWMSRWAEKGYKQKHGFLKALLGSFEINLCSEQKTTKNM